MWCRTERGVRGRTSCSILLWGVLLAGRLSHIHGLVPLGPAGAAFGQPTQHYKICRRHRLLFATSALRKDDTENNIYIDLDLDSDDSDGADGNGILGSISFFDHLSPDEAHAQKQKWISQLQQLAQKSSTDATAVSQAQAIYDTMFQVYAASEHGSLFWPSTDVYNCLLETLAFSKDLDNDYDAAKATESLLERMEDPNNDLIARPDAKSYVHVMDAWAIRSESSKVRAVLRRQIRRFEETGDESLCPTADTFNKLIKAWGISGDTNQADKLFRQMLEKGRDSVDYDPLDPRRFGVKANSKSWVQIMRAHLANDDDSKVSKKVEALFHEMLREGCEPQTEAYNQLIRATNDPKKAEALLFEMLERYRSYGQESVRPNSETFRQVMKSFGQSIGKDRRRRYVSPASVAAKVDQLVQIQEGLYETSGKTDDLRLNDKLCQVALRIVARSRDPKKATRAERILHKFKLNSPHISTRSYFFLLMACAYTDGTSEEKNEAFQVALAALMELRTSPHLTVDSGCTGMFIKACGNLMPASSKRDKAIQSAFEQCCECGLVDDFVVEELCHSASPSAHLSIFGGFIEDLDSIPKEWKRNIVRSPR